MEQTPRKAKSPASVLVTRWLLITSSTFMLTLFAVQRFNAKKPQLDIRNLGTAPLSVHHRANSFIVQPGQTWSIRFRAGDALTLQAGEATSSPSRTVVLENRATGPVGVVPSRVPVDVKLEGTNIMFAYEGVK